MTSNVKKIRGTKCHRCPTSAGTYWLPFEPIGDHIVSCMSQGMIFDSHVIDQIKPYIHEGSVVLDVGSNLGQMAMEFAKLVGPTGTVHAFEADYACYGILEANIAENNITNIIAHEGALWHEAGLELIYPEPDFVKMSCRGSWGIDPTIEFKGKNDQVLISTTIDQLDLDQVDVIKVDAQGSDLNILKGAINTIKKHRPVIIFEYEVTFENIFQQTLDEYKDFMTSLDYTVELAGHIQHSNYLCISNEKNRIL